MAEDAVARAVESFLLADTWEASKAVLAAEPLLLGDEAAEIVRGLVERAHKSGDASSAKLLEHHGQLLARCRAEGLDPAFADLIDTDGAPHGLEEIFAELAEPPASPADMPRRIELCREGLTQVSRDSDAEMWALLQSSLGTSLLLSPVGDRRAAIEASIAALDAAATEFGRLDRTLERARTRNNLGLALEARLTGSADDNLERAIDAYQDALELYRRVAANGERAETLNNLANAYNRRQQGRRDENRERAIALYEEALALIGDPRTDLWVRTRLNLGVALIERFRGNRLENLDRAIAAFRAGLEATDPTEDPTGWANLHANLGNAFSRRAAASGDDEDSERAIVAYESALEVYGDVRASLNRALTLSNLGNALLAYQPAAREPTVERAISCYRAALEILDPATSPLDWALAQNNLGRAYRERPLGEREENLELAIAAFEAASAVLDPRDAPVEYAQVAKNLGTAYRKRVRGDRHENLTRARQAYAQALDIRTEIYGPDHPRVASLLYSLAKVERAAGEHPAARAALSRALDIDEAGGGEPPAHLAAGYRSLALSARRMGDLPAAERAIRRALAIDEETNGPDHASVFTDLRELALIRAELGRHGSAADALERAVAIEDLSAGGADGGVREALTDLAELLRRAGDFAGAERTLERAVALDEGLFGPQHPRVAESLVKLAGLFNDGHQLVRARETLDRAVEIEQATGGRVPPRVSAALATLSRILLAGEPPAERSLAVVQSPRLLNPGVPGAVGLRFPERLHGHIGFGVDDPEEGRRTGRRDHLQLALNLEVAIDDVDRFLADPNVSATVTGSVECRQLGGERPIQRGSYDIRFDPAHGAQRTIAYELEVDGEDGYAVRGLRMIDAEQETDVLRRASTLFVWVTAADGRSAAGVVTVRHLDFLDQLDAIRVDAPTAAGRMAALDRFGRASLGPLWDFHERRGLESAFRPPR
jgi:tetratricopeptide (TPR) repeat protein